jgi:hypothetical protein
VGSEFGFWELETGSCFHGVMYVGLKDFFLATIGQCELNMLGRGVRQWCQLHVLIMPMVSAGSRSQVLLMYVEACASSIIISNYCVFLSGKILGN